MSRIYLFNGKITDLDILHNNKPFFRKMTNSIVEKKIYCVLKEYQDCNKKHKNIVDIYCISNNYIDIELLDVDKKIDFKDNKNQLLNIKSYLQSLGIIYIDWKSDQFGLDKHNIIKLYDFNASGIIDIKTNKWIDSPMPYFAFNRAYDIEKLRDPIEIDNFTFSKMFKK